MHVASCSSLKKYVKSILHTGITHTLKRIMYMIEIHFISLQKRYVLFLQKLSAVYGAKGWCFYLFSLVTFVLLECQENLIVSYYVMILV